MVSHQMSDPRGQHLCFAASRTGNDHDRPVPVEHRLPLWIIEFF